MTHTPPCNHVLLNIEQARETISRHIYGHFAEHLGRCIYDGFYIDGKKVTVPGIRGLRNDIIDALRGIDIPNLRWPGGCFADTYHWKDGIGPKHKRHAIVNRWWGEVTENNFFGTHEFLDLCSLLGAEPYIVTNIGTGTVQELADWVQYVNFKGISPITHLRKKNGRSMPWHVKYWALGNEVWGCGGNMTASYYANLYRQYATFMTGWSNTENLFRIASGPNGNDYKWTEILMRDIPHTLFEGIALHYYAVKDWNGKGPATGFSERQYMDIVKAALCMDEIIAKHISIMDAYDPGRKIALVVDEWGTWYDVEAGTHPGFLYQQNTMRDAVVAAATLNIFNKYCARVHMANLAQTVNVLQAVILTQDEKMWVTPTYHVMDMYKIHHDAVMVPVEVRCVNYKLNGESIPAISASASKSTSDTIHISLVNMHFTESQEISIQIPGAKVYKVSGRILTAANADDHNTYSHPDCVKPKTFHDYYLEDDDFKITIPSFSVCVMTVTV